MLDWSVMMKQELTVKVKFLIYWLVYVPTPTYGHDLWVQTEKYKIADTRH